MAVKYMRFYGSQVSLEDKFITIFANGRRCIGYVFCYLNFIYFLFLHFFLISWQLKALRLKELADDIKNQRLTQKSGKKSQEKSNQMDSVGSDLERSHTKELEEM